MNQSPARKTQQEKDDNKYNRKYAVHALALEILRNGPSLMTMLEAKEQAEKVYTQSQNRR